VFVFNIVQEWRKIKALQKQKLNTTTLSQSDCSSPNYYITQPTQPNIKKQHTENTAAYNLGYKNKTKTKQNHYCIYF